MTRRAGFSLLDVLLGSVVVCIGLAGLTAFFQDIFGQLNPWVNGGGLRRYIWSASMLKAEAEGLRATQYITPNSSDAKFIIEPPGSGYNLVITPAISKSAGQQYVLFDLDMQLSGQSVSKLTMTTLRSTIAGQNDKIGL